ncbi:MAG TPA: WYL domain-containing protein, partial [Pseudonocardiaceae bacterium]|nr:WYL domain-containing protein [Pseudonocardiaceae bacterium]
PRAIAAPFVPEPPDDLRGLAESLLAAGLEPEPADGGLTTEVRKFGSHLTSQEINWLTSALQQETPVEITYLDQNDRGSRRVITPLEVIGGRVEAWCHLRDDERHFLISRIQHVLPASA